jgi:hypothetical protein
MVTFNAGSDPRDVLAPDRLRRMVMVDVTGLASETECRKAARALFDVGSIPILAPASVPPVSAECNEAVQMSADGNASPLLCPNGGVNVPAWNNYTGSYGAILALGPSATESTVISTMCSVSPPYPEIENAGILASHYYGWSFADSTAISDFPFYPSAADNECSS